MVFLEAWARPLLVLHALSAMALLGAAVHLLVYAWPYLAGRPVRARAERRFTAILLAAFAATFATGALAYPNYRVNVRAAFLEARSPEVTRLFDLKENWATLGLALAGALFWMRRRIDPRAEPVKARVYVALAALTAALVLFNVVAGLLIVMHGAAP